MSLLFSRLTNSNSRSFFSHDTLDVAHQSRVEEEDPSLPWLTANTLASAAREAVETWILLAAHGWAGQSTEKSILRQWTGES